MVTCHEQSSPMSNLFLTKLLTIFVYPLGAAITASAIAFALSFTSWWRIGQLLLGFALVALGLQPRLFSPTGSIGGWNRNFRRSTSRRCRKAMS